MAVIQNGGACHEMAAFPSPAALNNDKLNAVWRDAAALFPRILSGHQFILD